MNSTFLFQASKWNVIWTLKWNIEIVIWIEFYKIINFHSPKLQISWRKKKLQSEIQVQISNFHNHFNSNFVIKNRLRNLRKGFKSPGLTTCRFVSIIPRRLSTTKPVAELQPADSVSNARQAVVRRTTTAGTTLLRAFRQSSAVARFSLNGGSIPVHKSSFIILESSSTATSDINISDHGERRANFPAAIKGYSFHSEADWEREMRGIGGVEKLELALTLLRVPLFMQ